MSKGKSGKQNLENGNKVSDIDEDAIIFKTEIQSEINKVVDKDVPSTSIDVDKSNKEETIPVEVSEVKPVVKIEDKKPVETKVNIITLENKIPKTEHKKDYSKVEIVDVSKKKEHHKKTDKISKVIEPILDKTMDSLILAGSGIIAVTGLTSKILATIGTNLIRK